jgi:hypothetical protein
MSADLLISMKQTAGLAHGDSRHQRTQESTLLAHMHANANANANITTVVMHAIDALALLHWLQAAGGQPHVALRIHQRVWGAIGQLWRRVEDLWTAVPV